VCLLLPSAWLAWTWRDLPHLGPIHDDTLYLVGAKSITERGEYRILSLPGEPYQAKYPPLYPAYLSLAWLIEPSFPANLPWAMLLQWLWTPVLLWLVWLVSRNFGMPERLRWALMVAFAFAPYVNFFGIHLMTETMATALSIAACLLAEKRPWAAGLVTGLTFLTRTACVPLFAVMPLLYALQRRWRDAGVFLATSLPAFLIWTWWSGTHRMPTEDPALLYYTNYLAIYVRDLAVVDVPMMVWKNVSTFLVSVGQCMVFTLAENMLTMNLARCMGLLAVIGTVRMVRKNKGWRQPYVLFSAVYALLLLIWNYPPDPRFVLPVVPLLMAGFLTELAALYGILQQARTSRKKDERVFARIVTPVLAGAACLALYTNLDGAFFHLPAENASQRERVRRAQAAYDWVKREAPVQARFYAIYDPLFYLYTGRQAMRLPVPAHYAYQDDPAALKKLAYPVRDFAAQRGLDYVFLSRREPQSLLKDEEREELWRLALQNGAAFQRGDVAILKSGHPAVHEQKITAQHHQQTAAAQ
jgi:hypothetical protein